MPKGTKFKTSQTKRNEPEDLLLIEAELKSVLESRHFRRSARLRDFLHFVVKTALQGNIDRPKEYVIGVDVFGRKETFDQRKDSIVRVQANRLRRKLKLYYATDGVSNPIRITLPLGGFVPLFTQSKSAGSEPNPDTRLSSRASDLFNAHTRAPRSVST